MITRWIGVLLGALFTLSIGCTSNPACEDAVVRRLLDDCRVIFGYSSGIACADRPDAISNDYGFLADICAVVDPDVDVECLKTVACDQISTCQTETPTLDAQCAAACVDAQRACADVCAGQGDPYASCTSCLLDCEGDIQKCFDGCPEA